MKTLLDYVENPDKVMPKGTEDFFRVFSYMQREDKTQTEYVTAVNCLKDIALQQMILTKKQYGKVDGYIAWHGYQSFKPGELSPDEAHQIGVMLAKEMWGDRFQIVVTTHLDKDHLHNHFAFNSVSFRNGSKYNYTKAEQRRLREVSDKLCREHRLSVIEQPHKAPNRVVWLDEKSGKPTRYNVYRRDVKLAVGNSYSIRRMEQYLRRLGYITDFTGKHWKIRLPQYAHFTRLDTLNAEWTPQNISDALGFDAPYGNRRAEVFGPPNLPEDYRNAYTPHKPTSHIYRLYAAGVVQEVFRLCMEGKGNDAIARILQDRRIPNCTAYWAEKGIKRAGNGRKVNPDPYKWKSTTIASMLSRQEYCGDIVNFKTYSKSFKKKNRLENPKENWVIFKDKHEPIIDRDTFERVQELIAGTKRRTPKPCNGDKSIFANLLCCADCGHKLWHHTNPVNKDIRFFSCSNYAKDYRGSCKTRHYIREDAITEVVRLELKQMAAYLTDHEEEFALLLAQKSKADMLAEKKLLKEELEKANARSNKLFDLYEKLYEDNTAGKVTDEWFMQLSRKYEVERMELKGKIRSFHERLSELDSAEENNDHFIRAIRKFMAMEALTAPLLKELIDHIDVYETEGVGKSRTQRITIYYRFVGYVELPDTPEKYHTENTRPGVEVEYITRPA